MGEQALWSTLVGSMVGTLLGVVVLALLVRLTATKDGAVEWTKFKMTCSKCGHTRAFVKDLEGGDGYD